MTAAKLRKRKYTTPPAIAEEVWIENIARHHDDDLSHNNAIYQYIHTGFTCTRRHLCHPLAPPICVIQRRRPLVLNTSVALTTTYELATTHELATYEYNS